MRLRKNRSQEELAVETGMSRVKLSSHENGIRSNMSNEDLITATDYFNISKDALLKSDLS